MFLSTPQKYYPYDFLARTYAPDEARFWQPDPNSGNYHWLSPYSYCGGDPGNRIDPDGNLIIFINGMHFGDGGSSNYWEGMDKLAMRNLQDKKAIYIDGSFGGNKEWPNNMNCLTRYIVGHLDGTIQAESILSSLKDGEKIRIVTHSMGASYAKVFLSGLDTYGKENNVDAIDKIDFELDLAPHQADEQEPYENVRTYVIQHDNDGVAPPLKMPGAISFRTHKTIFRNCFSLLTEHRI